MINNTITYVNNKFIYIFFCHIIINSNYFLFIIIIFNDYYQKNLKRNLILTRIYFLIRENTEMCLQYIEREENSFRKNFYIYYIRSMHKIHKGE